MRAKKFRILSAVLSLSMALSLVTPATVVDVDALSYSGSSSYKSGKYYSQLISVNLTGNQRTDIVNVANSQIGYQEGSSSSQLSGTVYGSKNYTEYGRWYGMQDMWCAMFVSWCANVAGVSTSVVPSHAYTPSGLQWFKDRGRAYSRATVANGGYTPKKGDIIYFRSERNSNPTNHVGIVTKYSNGTVYTVEGNTSSATISTNGGSVCSKSYSISNTYIVYICSPAYSGTDITDDGSLVPSDLKDVVFNAEYYANAHADLKSTFGTDATKLYNHYLEFGIKEGRQASPIFDIKYYVNQNSDLKEKYGTDYLKAMEHFVSFGVKEARKTAEPADLGTGFYAKITGKPSGKNLSLSDTNVIIYPDSTKPAQVWKFDKNKDGTYTLTNQKNGLLLSVADASHKSGANVQIETANNGNGQKWYVYSYNGQYVLRAACASARVLDVYGGLTDDMTNVQSYTFNGTTAQLFSIKKVEKPADAFDAPVEESSTEEATTTVEETTTEEVTTEEVATTVEVTTTEEVTTEEVTTTVEGTSTEETTTEEVTTEEVTTTVEETSTEETTTVEETSTEVTTTEEVTTTVEEISTEELTTEENTSVEENSTEETTTEEIATEEPSTEEKLVDAQKAIIIQRPASATYYCKDKAKALSVRARVKDDGELTYQWYKNKKKSTKGATKITGATEQTYTPDTQKAGSVYYYCIITNTNKNVNGKQVSIQNSGYAKVQVRKCPNKISNVSSSYKKSMDDKSFRLKPEANGTITYKTSNPKVVTVSTNGVVTLQGVGSAKIVITAGNDSYQKVLKTVNIRVAPGKVDLTTIASNDKKSISVKWEKKTDITGFKIQYSLTKDFKEVKTSYVGSLRHSKTRSDLVKGKKYYVRICAYKKIGKTTYYSDYSDTKVYTVKSK